MPGSVDGDGAPAGAGAPAAREVRPRIWPAMVTPLIAVIAANIAAGLGLVGAAFARGAIDVRSGDFSRSLMDFAMSPPGMIAAFAPAQAVFLAAALLAARLSREPLLRRLNLGPSRLPLWAYPLVMVGTLLVPMVINILFSTAGLEPSEQLEALTRGFAGAGGAGAAAVLLVASVLPGVCEELLFRGFTQSRLERRWRAWVAVAVSAAIFGAAHLDPQHALYAFFLGLWIGAVARRAGSIRPAIACHFFNNFVVIGAVMALAGARQEPVEMDRALWGVYAAVAGVAFAGALVVLVRIGRNPLPEAAGPRSP